MTNPIPIVLSWSGGKDCLLMLRRLQADPRYRVVGLLTTVWTDEACVAMHGVPVPLIQAQAVALGLGLAMVEVPRFPTNQQYEAAMASVVEEFRARGITTFGFGDLFLEDIRRYREELCVRLGITPVFPVWGLPTSELADEFIQAGYRARICCTDVRLGIDAIGTEYDAAFLRELPAGIDPCGENGEFHTFVTDGPGFTEPVAAAIIGVKSAAGFWWAQWADLDQKPIDSHRDLVAASSGVEHA